MTSVKKNIFKNGIASIFQKGIRVLDQLVLVPFFLAYWGAEFYGEWLTLTVIPSILAFSDLGFGSAAANSFVLAYVADEKQNAADINKTGILMISIAVSMGIVLSSLLLFALDSFDLFNKINVIQRKDAVVSVSILILARLFDFYSQLFQSYFIAARKAALGISLSNVKIVLSLIFGILILILGYGVIEFAFVQLIVIVLFLSLIHI